MLSNTLVPFRDVDVVQAYIYAGGLNKKSTTNRYTCAATSRPQRTGNGSFISANSYNAVTKIKYCHICLN